MGGEFMAQKTFSLHEKMELHELLNFKSICITTSKLMQGLVFDQDLKDLMEKDVQQSYREIQTLQNLYKESQTLQ
jgi:similar to spore coat protein